MADISEIAPKLKLDDTGIWSTPALEAISYPQDGNHACFLLEDSSFWFRHRNACITAAAKRLPPPNDGAIFDIGGGNGFVSLGLMNAGFKTVLVEPGPEGAANGKRRGIPTVICATTTDAGFRDSTLDAVGLFDVIEHIEDDVSFVESMKRLLKPGGRLYATVPTYSALWSSEDVDAGHYRRYTRSSISALIEGSGLKVDYATYIFRPLPLPIFLLRSLPTRLGLTGNSHRDTTNDHQAGASSGILESMLKGEVTNIDAGKAMAFGASCLVVASRR